MTDALVLGVSETPLLRSEGDAIIVPVLQDGTPTGNGAALEEMLGGLLGDMRRRGEFRGELHQVVVVPTMGRIPAARAAFVGLGKQADCTVNTYRLAMATVTRTLGKRGLLSAIVDLGDAPFPAEEAGVALAEGAELSRYVPDPYRTSDRRDVRLQELRAVGTSMEALREGSIRGRAKNLARELVNEPGNILDPPEMARRAVEMAAEVGLECEVLEEADMERLRMGAILAVTRGAEAPARFIVLRHRPAEAEEGGPLLALIGKAVTFDTGGVSLKPSIDMGRMKGDMAGGAAVVGAMRAIAELKVPAQVVGLVPVVVNMPDGSAWKPGDVITAMSGKTIETITTDAEGRMLLADALCYARTLKATHMVDVATLTGACVTALGHVASGLYGTDDELVEAVKTCGEAAGERHWPMPLFPEYRELNRSDVADLKNSGGRTAGSITAAFFLREFALDTPWAHLDIAGSSQYEKGKAWAPAGPTGTGVGTFINLAQRLAGVVRASKR
jgi:leucyl aminopeptidase